MVILRRLKRDSNEKGHYLCGLPQVSLKESRRHSHQSEGSL